MGMIQSNHAHFFVMRVKRCLALGLTLWLLALVTFPVAAQTPPPWPTPIVTDAYVIHQDVTYGDGGVIVTVLFVAGLLLLDIFLRVTERLTDR